MLCDLQANPHPQPYTHRCIKGGGGGGLSGATPLKFLFYHQGGRVFVTSIPGYAIYGIFDFHKIAPVETKLININ